MAPLTLFYSWQMDRSTKVCRDFIRRALDEAAAILALNDDIALKIDSDTQDVPGTPAITETILGKIRDCDIFLADMTFVAEAGGKLIPNPNVMGEYGYALRDKGTRRILLVMNEAYGLADKLPFDLHHLRHPEGYAIGVDVADGARRAARTDLGRRLADYIGLIAKEVKAEVARTEAERSKALADLWWSTLQARSFNDRPALVSTPSVVIHVLPSTVLSAEELEPRQVKPARRYLKIDDDADAIEGADGHHWWAHGPKRTVPHGSNPEARWYGRLLQPGVVEWELSIGERVDDDPSIVVDGKALERLIVKAADRSHALTATLNLRGPSLIGIVLYGLETVELAGPQRTRPFGKPSLILPISLVPEGATRSGDHLRKAFDRLWMSAGFEDGSPSFSEQHWAS